MALVLAALPVVFSNLVYIWKYVSTISFSVINFNGFYSISFLSGKYILVFGKEIKVILNARVSYAIKISLQFIGI